MQKVTVHGDLYKVPTNKVTARWWVAQKKGKKREREMGLGKNSGQPKKTMFNFSPLFHSFSFFLMLYVWASFMLASGACLFHCRYRIQSDLKNEIGIWHRASSCLARSLVRYYGTKCLTGQLIESMWSSSSRLSIMNKMKVKNTENFLDLHTAETT